ncbi:hypothetical protein [Afifella sp. IM 167]|uniref:hypothetical protein n=1 Tax=Afifella sp. IM 167 TaxID=2033586 RepID=UPI001CCD17BF|nr:hypothetical protein [Afifella sp. IM 167]MBZ8132980.1 hypothetical protein [Afifella sp. IM 167]
MSTTLAEVLKAFNRKERYWLLRDALGSAGAEVPLSQDFQAKLSAKIGRDVPCDAWWAMDYHIDWFFAALVYFYLGADRTTEAPHENPTMHVTNEGKRSRLIRGSQEDFDMIVAFDNVAILIEAKFEGAWSNSQIDSKRQRLREFGQAWPKLSGKETGPNAQASIFLVLTSPKESKGLEAGSWPRFLHLDQNDAPFFMQLDFAHAPKTFLQPLRCDKNGESNADGDWWQIHSVSRPRTN